MIFCIAPLAISWALVFSDPPADSVTMQPQAWQCFSELAHCQSAEAAANFAFKLDLSRHQAKCEPQPAGRPEVGANLTPYGRR